MTEEYYEKWGNYFRYFYFHEEMTFTDFLESVAIGEIPKRGEVDWNRTVGPYAQGEL